MSTWLHHSPGVCHLNPSSDGRSQPIATEYQTVCQVVLQNDCLLLILADEEFDELCFEFGLELDEIVSNQCAVAELNRHFNCPVGRTSMSPYEV